MALNLTVIAHSEDVGNGRRTTVYRTALNSGRKDITFRVRIRQDTYPQQRYAIVDIFDPITNQFVWFYGEEDPSAIGKASHGPALWELDDALVVVIARHLGEDQTMVHFETEGALTESGHLDDGQAFGTQESAGGRRLDG